MSDGSKGRSHEESHDQLDLLRKITGADRAEEGKPRAGVVGPPSVSEMLQADARMSREQAEVLRRGGSDLRGREKLREFFRRLGRG
jgi:hypothetical protein